MFRFQTIGTQCGAIFYSPFEHFAFHPIGTKQSAGVVFKIAFLYKIPFLLGEEMKGSDICLVGGTVKRITQSECLYRDITMLGYTYFHIYIYIAKYKRQCIIESRLMFSSPLYGNSKSTLKYTWLPMCVAAQHPKLLTTNYVYIQQD